MHIHWRIKNPFWLFLINFAQITLNNYFIILIKNKQLNKMVKLDDLLSWNPLDPIYDYFIIFNFLFMQNFVKWPFVVKNDFSLVLNSVNEYSVQFILCFSSCRCCWFYEFNSKLKITNCFKMLTIPFLISIIFQNS